MKPALRWGLLIGLINLLWLYGSFYIGLHEQGLRGMQMTVVVHAIINVMSYVLALGIETRSKGAMPYWKGVCLGAAISVVCAAVAALAQVGYFTFVNPGWTNYMVAETRKHFEKVGLSPEQIDAFAERAATSFSLPVYVVQSIVMALSIGIVLSLILMLILRAKKQKPAPQS